MRYYFYLGIHCKLFYCTGTSIKSSGRWYQYIRSFTMDLRHCWQSRRLRFYSRTTWCQSHNLLATFKHNRQPCLSKMELLQADKNTECYIEATYWTKYTRGTRIRITGGINAD